PPLRRGVRRQPDVGHQPGPAGQPACVHRSPAERGRAAEPHRGQQPPERGARARPAAAGQPRQAGVGAAGRQLPGAGAPGGRAPRTARDGRHRRPPRPACGAGVRGVGHVPPLASAPPPVAAKPAPAPARQASPGQGQDSRFAELLGPEAPPAGPGQPAAGESAAGELDAATRVSADPAQEDMAAALDPGSLAWAATTQPPPAWPPVGLAGLRLSGTGVDQAAPEVAAAGRPGAAAGAGAPLTAGPTLAAQALATAADAAPAAAADASALPAD